MIKFVIVNNRKPTRAPFCACCADKLEDGQPVAEAIYASGFGSSSRAYESAPAGLGMTPGARRHGGAGQNVLYIGGNVRWCVQRTVGQDRDDIYVNKFNLLRAGEGRSDTVLGPGDARPLGE